MNILSLLSEKNIITKEDVASVENELRTKGGTAESILIKKGLDPNIILETKSGHLNTPVFHVGDKKVSSDILGYIPEESALHYKFVPVGLSDGILAVGLIDPNNIKALDALNFISSKINLPFKVFLISETDFNKVINMYQGLSQEVTRALGEYELESAANADKTAVRFGKDAVEDTKQLIKEDAPVTKIVDNLLKHAVDDGASDIHIEPVGDSIRVRFRVDGILNIKLTLPSKILKAVVSRVKILSGLRLDEQRKPQDGRFSMKIDGRKIDFRVSTFPSYYGEKVVMRILDTESGSVSLEEIGLSKQNLKTIKRAVNKPHGIILISGPTGSGKTTTLYAMLKEFDRDHKNVLSLEDPIEYNIPGVNQSQMHPEIGYSFASGLRTVLRQDPDIIMVGEIRDKETAELAIKAALTGHLVLSTIHTNDAVGVISRLVEMGIDPYLIAPTLIVSIAQRLVPRLCEGTGVPISAEGGIKIMIDKAFEDLPGEYRKIIPNISKVYEIEPTKECPSGVSGRIGVFEILEVNGEIQKIILNNPTDIAIAEAARRNGMLSMKEDAIIKASNKIISFKEIGTLDGEFLAAEDAINAEEVKKVTEDDIVSQKKKRNDEG